MTEAAIQREILDAVGALPGVQVWRTAAICAYLPDGRGGYRPIWPLPVGWPDLTAIVDGWALAVEVKRPGGRMSGQQRRMQGLWQSAGGVWVVATSAQDALDAVAALRGRAR